MYFIDKNKVFEDFPCIQEEKTIIVNFISLDATSDVYLNDAIYATYPALQNKVDELLYDEKIKINNLFPFSKTRFNNLILNIPYRLSFEDPIEDEFVIENIKKAEQVIEKYNPKSVYFSKTQITEELFNKIKINNKFKLI